MAVLKIREISENHPINVREYDLSKITVKQEFGAKRKYPFDILNVGEGFEIPKIARAKPYAAAKHYMKEHPEINIVLARDEFDNSIMVRTK